MGSGDRHGIDKLYYLSHKIYNSFLHFLKVIITFHNLLKLDFTVKDQKTLT